MTESWVKHSSSCHQRKICQSTMRSLQSLWILRKSRLIFLIHTSIKQDSLCLTPCLNLYEEENSVCCTYFMCTIVSYLVILVNVIDNTIQTLLFTAKNSRSQISQSGRPGDRRNASVWECSVLQHWGITGKNSYTVFLSHFKKCLM